MESESHKRLKRKDAGITGKTEVSLPSGGRIDALTGTGIAVEIERGGSPGIEKSVASLREALRSGLARKAKLRVPNKDLDAAEREMRRQGLGGELTNLGGTTRRNVPKKRGG